MTTAGIMFAETAAHVIGMVALAIAIGAVLIYALLALAPLIVPRIEDLDDDEQRLATELSTLTGAFDDDPQQQQPTARHERP